MTLREDSGDIWDRFGKSFIVIPTNIGHKRGSKGLPGPNVMGAGVAAKAAEQVPGLPQLYGEYCARFGEGTEVTYDLTTGLVLFPTKSLNVANPGMSWKSKSTIELIRKSAMELANLVTIGILTRAAVAKHSDTPTTLEDDDIYLPHVGCGAGGLSLDEVAPVLRSILTDDRFILMRYIPF